MRPEKRARSLACRNGYRIRIEGTGVLLEELRDPAAEPWQNFSAVEAIALTQDADVVGRREEEQPPSSRIK